jgi:hypothetical protein
MPLSNVGLYMAEAKPIVGYSAGAMFYKPMQFMVKFAIDRKTDTTMQKMYLQQMITPFVGGRYTRTNGFDYVINVKKSAGIQRMLVNVDNIEDDINNLIEEANRFMYMYCRTDIL